MRLVGILALPGLAGRSPTSPTKGTMFPTFPVFQRAPKKGLVWQKPESRSHILTLISLD
jgi:hypothetical protein